MSYSGFTELLCLRGHYSGHDAYETAPKKCHCGAHFRWSHGVDQTNGYDESHPSSCEAPKEQVGSEDEWHIDPYGNRYARVVLLFAANGDGIWIRINSRGHATPPYPDDLAQWDRNPQGEKPQALSAKHESPVGETDAPKTCPGE